MCIPAVARFALACFLFVAWMGYLVYLAATSSKPVVLSRPQLLVSDIDVIAEVDGLDKPVVVKQVLSSRIKDETIKPETKLTIDNLGDCQVSPDWPVTKLYLLPLKREGGGYAVTRIPPSPGFDSSRSEPRIYPRTDDVLRQYHEIRGEP